MTSRHEGWQRTLALAVSGLAAALVWLSAGFYVIIAMIVTPDPGAEIVVAGLKVALVAGWLAAFVWLVRDLGRGRLWFLAAPFAAWAWVILLSLLLGNVAFLDIGY